MPVERGVLLVETIERWTKRIPRLPDPQNDLVPRSPVFFAGCVGPARRRGPQEAAPDARASYAVVTAVGDDDHHGRAVWVMRGG